MSRAFVVPAVLLLCGSAALADPPQVIPGWGTVANPGNDCRIALKDGQLEIAVPATLHDLNPRNGALTAPRVLREVEGDFAIKVRVGGTLQPGTRSTAPRSVAFCSAGLLVWADEKHYVRLERNTFISGGRAKCFPPLFEVFVGGVEQKAGPRAADAGFFKTPATTFVLARQGNELAAFFSHDGKTWERVKQITATLPKKVKVGVAVVNTSDRAVTAQFDGFQVAKDVPSLK